jgi:hypothetical protein
MSPTNLVLHPPPLGILPADGYGVEINGQPLFLYPARVNFSRVPDMDLFPELTCFGYFDMSAEVDIVITSQQAFEFVDVRPKALGIIPQIEGKTLRFHLSEPTKFTVEFDGDLRRTVHLFANPIEIDAPSPNDPGVCDFGPGIHRPGVISLQDHQTIYIAGGAYVHGIVRANGIRQVCVRGRGILSAETFPWPQGLFQIEGCSSVVLRDLVLLDSAGWTVKIDACRDVLVENIKLICSRRNCDGIDLCSTLNAVVKGCFIRNWDDALCIKGLNKGDSRNTWISDCVLWSDAAQSIEIGYETQSDHIEDVFIRDIDIIHHLMPGYLCLTVHNGDRAQISNIHFENIRVEETVAPLFDLWIDKAHWNKDDRRGHIQGIYFKNIMLIGGADPAMTSRSEAATEGLSSEVSYLATRASRIAGYDAQHAVRGVTFENVNVLGKWLSSPADDRFLINEFVENVAFLPPADGTPVINLEIDPPVTVGHQKPIVFDASRSFAQGSDIVSYHWLFGDGQVGNGRRLQHTYQRPGNYAVNLTVIDAHGRTASLPRILSVLPLYQPIPLDAPSPGLRYSYVEGDFNFGTDFVRLVPQRCGIISGLELPPRSRPGYHGLIYEGYIRVPVDGLYRFNVVMDFGSGYDMLAGGSISLHNRLVSANNGGWGQIGLGAGLHPLRVTLFRKSGSRAVEFQYMGPDHQIHAISPGLLFHDPSKPERNSPCRP